MALPHTINFSCLPRCVSARYSAPAGVASPDWSPVTQTQVNPAAEVRKNTIPYLTTSPNQDNTAESFPQELIRAQELERQKLASELHDDLGQSLILIKNEVLKLKNNEPGQTETFAQLNALADMVTAALQKIRNITYELQPYELNLLGLIPALQSLIEKTAIAVPWTLTADLPNLNQLFQQEQELYIYRIIQECLAIILEQNEICGVRLLAFHRLTVVTFEIQVQGSATFFADLAANFLKNYHILRLQEQLKMVNGKIIFTASAPRITTMQINIPLN